MIVNIKNYIQTTNKFFQINPLIVARRHNLAVGLYCHFKADYTADYTKSQINLDKRVVTGFTINRY